MNKKIKDCDIKELRKYCKSNKNCFACPFKTKTFCNRIAYIEAKKLIEKFKFLEETEIEV